jgi:hypothetical protein
MSCYSQAFQKELPGVAAFLRLAALAGFIMIFIMTDWYNLRFVCDGDLTGPVFRIAGISIFLASLATFFEVLGDSKIKRKKVILGILILLGSQFAPFLHIYTDDLIDEGGFIPLVADFIALVWITIMVTLAVRFPKQNATA